MAGLFYVPGICSWITWIRSEFHLSSILDHLDSILGVNLGFLGFLCFQLSSILDSILDPFASV